MMTRSIRPNRALTATVCLLCAAVLALTGPAAAQRKGRLAGNVVNKITDQPIEGALVAIQGTTTSTLTDRQGRFHFDLPEGKYGITIFKEDFFSTNYLDIPVRSGRVTTYRCEMVYGDPTQNIFFSIGGITVLDQRPLLPEEIETTHHISSAEIEHQLSTNLGDILTILPGVERSAPPGLSKKTQVGLRGAGDIGGTEQTLALFGTKVIIDDITLSNNANLQRGTGTTYGGTSQTTGSQVDLRTIPADNIHSVTVITGVPSVEYGDLTTGLIKVETKAGRQPHRLKIKSNPDTKEGNFNGGVFLGGTGLTYNANLAFSERDIRRDGDEYYRYNAQLTTRNRFMGDRLSLLNRFNYTGVSDEQNVDVKDPLSIEQYNRDKRFLYGHSVEYRPTADTRIEWTGSINYTRRDSYLQRLTGADVRILTDATEPGTYPGVFGAGAYLARTWTKGEERNINAKLNFRWNFGAARFDHALLAGGEYTYDDNRGQGKIFDPLLPPGGNPGQRPLPYDASPALKNASLYFEDEISGALRLRPWSVNLGFRYEMYTPESLNLAGLFGDEDFVSAKNGAFFNPRVRMRLELDRDTQVRLSWGKSSKMPPLTNIFQGPLYIDVVEDNRTPAPDSIPLISTYVWNFDNTYLKGYQNEKIEGSLDRKLGPVGLSLTGFWTQSKEMPRMRNYPITLYRYRWTDWPNQDDPDARSAIDTIYTEASGKGFYDYPGWYRNWGFEFQLRTQRIERLSTVFRVSGSYNRNRGGAEGTYMSSVRNNRELGHIYPLYFHTERWSQRVLMNYSAEWLIKRLGMWVTFFVQQTMYDWNQSSVDPVTYAAGYYDPRLNQTVYITPERSAELGLDRTYDDLSLLVRKRPNDRFLFNINVSKSLGRNAEVSMFVHNVLDDPAYYVDEQGFYRSRNHSIFYGIEFSVILDPLLQKARSGFPGGARL